MMRALSTAGTGMVAQQMNLDVIANNLANVNTTGFKKSKTEFQDILYETTRAAGADQGGGNQVPTSLQIGQGTRLAATSKVFCNLSGLSHPVSREKVSAKCSITTLTLAGINSRQG